MTNQIIMLGIDKLEHHPDNPRKNIGDISELTASIQKDGILQNLTVVKKPGEDGRYLVVIGNRRLEAALAAGLSELPCVVSDMDHTKQIETMLIENINRSDLTPAEEAEGFRQLTLAGFSAEDIAEKTGFSVSTVNRRLKIAEYKTKAVNEALERGATLADFVKLEALKDKKTREKLLQDIGTNNFNYRFNSELTEQTIKENEKLIRKLLKGKAKELTSEELGDTWSSRCKYKNDTDIHKDIFLTEPFTNKSINLKSNDEVFFCFRYRRCEFFKLKPKTEEAKNDTGPKHTEAQKQYERNRRQLNKMAIDFYNLRKEFVESLSDKKTLPGWKDICLEYIGLFAIHHGYFDLSVDYGFLCNKNLNDGSPDDKFIKRKEYYESHSAGFIVNQIYKAWGDSSIYSWHDNEQYAHPEFAGNSALDLFYEFLCKLGYQMCDDEIKCRNGTHELMQKIK